MSVGGARLRSVDDELWAAIGDPTRRRVLDLLLRGPGNASELSRQLPVTRQAVAKHLAVLERAGLVHASAVGRQVQYGIEPAQFARAVSQLEAVGQAWDGRLQRIKALAEAIERASRSTDHDRT